MLYDITIFCIVFGVGIIGITCCAITLYIIYKNSVLHNAFGFICAMHGICEFFILATFTFWGAPLILFKGIVQDHLLGATIGIICSFAYYFALYLQFLKSINRLCAIILPLQYRTIFSKKHLVKIIVFILIISLLTTLPYFLHDCNFYFSREYFTFTVRDNDCYSNIVIYLDMGSGCISSVISIACDSVTFCYLRLLGKKMRMCPFKRCWLSKTNNKNILDKHNPATLSREIRFFFQACMTSFLYTLMLISFHIISKLTTDEWLMFITTTMAWQLCHTLNEIFFILFNLKQQKTISIQITGKSSTHETTRSRPTMVAVKNRSFETIAE